MVGKERGPAARNRLLLLLCSYAAVVWVDIKHPQSQGCGISRYDHMVGARPAWHIVCCHCVGMQ